MMVLPGARGALTLSRPREIRQQIGPLFLFRYFCRFLRACQINMIAVIRELTEEITTFIFFFIVFNIKQGILADLSQFWF